MDEDLVLNITTESGSSVKHSSSKGGKWTDRVKAKRAAKRKNVSEHPSKSITQADLPERPSKRQRMDDNTNVFQPSRAAPRPQVISSLFSSNPKVDTPASLPRKSVMFKSSNAPLEDSSTFSGLGLDPLITSHLSNKMDIQNPTAIQRTSLSILLHPEKHDLSNHRDVFIQSQTGSGKTLSYLLPIIQDLLPLSSLSYIDRSIGTLAVIIAPTRELARQISDVLETLLQMRLRPKTETPDGDNPSSTRLTRWLVSGLLTGGGTRTHEKARLRKGIPILVSTPGRLLDHLQNTSTFNVGKCRWLVLDEADRLMELGFEETISGILKGLNGRRKLAVQAMTEGIGIEVGGWDWERRRRTLLCSATIREDVQKLAGNALVDPVMLKATEADLPVKSTSDTKSYQPSSAEKFTPPSQLSQKYVVTPLKLRLVTLVALLRSIIANSQSSMGTKIIVFFSCTDSVDFHWSLIGKTAMTGSITDTANDSDAEEEEETASKSADVDQRLSQIRLSSLLLPNTSIYRLHGSLSTAIRLASLKQFSAKERKQEEPSSSILFCTSVASRGLDLPLVRAVIQYDLPTEGGADEYIHRVGRTARAGKGGVAWSLVAPSEVEWVKFVERSIRGEDKKSGSVSLFPETVESVMRSGFGGKGSEYEERATEVQLAFERWVLQRSNTEVARRAFLSHLRAYSTHPSNEKHIFHVRHLHTGHLAKSFALREAPKTVTRGGSHAKDNKSFKASKKPSKKRTENNDGDSDLEVSESKDVERRMQAIVREQGRLSKKGGMMRSSGVSEYHIAGGDDLEKLVNRK